MNFEKDLLDDNDCDNDDVEGDQAMFRASEQDAITKRNANSVENSKFGADDNEQGQYDPRCYRPFPRFLFEVVGSAVFDGDGNL